MVSETGAAPETLTGDQRAQQEPGLIKNVGSILGGPKNVVEIFRGQALANLDALAKERTQASVSNCGYSSERNGENSKPAPSTRILCGELEWTVEFC